ncbi:uncharacterized protein LOC128667673 [Microplitis demolitor]|uniref:uncharacterized protein LOC128667673 n=1 Tax=Microplitis demolitor TaxID=69319 RepID=UPI00235B5C12|nr:uncharacterized protein LOC128667673 [Microplitis demolitor]
MITRKRKDFINLSKRQQRRRIDEKVLSIIDENLHLKNDFHKKKNDSIVEVNVPSENNTENSTTILSNSNVDVNNSDFQWDNDFEYAHNDDNDSDYDDDDHHDNIASNFSFSHIDQTSLELKSQNMMIDTNEIDKIKSLTSFIQNWHIKHRVTREASDELLHGLQAIMGFNIPLTIRSIIKTPRCIKNIVDHNAGKFLYYSIEQAITDRLFHIDISKIPPTLDLYINVDGLPISKSSKSEFWPILGKVLNISCFAEPFVIAIYHGIGKPSSLDQYLQKFCKEYLSLNKEGFIYKNHKVKISIKGFLADTPAKNFLRSFCGHTSRCGECIQTGKTVNHCRIFLETNSPLRTDNHFRINVPEQYKSKKSPLEDIGISMTKDFPLDYMHLVCLGVMKKLLLIWVQLLKGSDQNEDKKFATFNKFFMSLSSSIPSDFVRKPRCLKEVNRWKATEFRLFLLYLGPVVLRSILPQALLIHFNVLNCAIRILCDPKEYRKNDVYANELLVYFVETMKTLYGEVSLICNVHNLIHITKYVLDHGHLDEFSVFCFENFLQSLKNMIRTGNLPLQQVMNRIIEKSKNFKPKNELFPFQFKLVAKISKTSNLPEGCNNEYKSIEFINFKLTNTTPNNCCYLQDDTVVFITAICHYKENAVIVGHALTNPLGLEDYPCDSRNLGIYKVDEISDLRIWHVRHIIRKGFVVVNYDSCYVFPILHSDF